MTERRQLIGAAASLAALTVFAKSARAKELGQISEPSFVLPRYATDCHSHIFDPEKFPYSASRRYTPPSATLDDLLRMHDKLGLQREVLVQPSVYGADNSCILAALRKLGTRARGIAVIDSSFSRAQLDDLMGAGIRGVRLNLEVAKNTDTAVAVDRLKRAADQLADTPMIVQLYAVLPVIVACAPAIRSMNRRVLIDHFAIAKTEAGLSQPGFAELLELMASPNVFMKLSGPYQISNKGPDYADITPIAQPMIAASPTRVVWGSDWPHTSGTNRPANFKFTDIEPFRKEDDGHDVSLIKDWAPQASQREQLLVSNPAALFGFS